MRASLQLSQQLTVKMMLKPELQQSLQLLQLSGFELLQYLNEQAVENPLLEIEQPLAVFRDRRTRSGTYASGDWDPLSAVPAKNETLESNLLSQLRIAGVTGRLYKIAAFLAGNLDEAGYLTISVSETASLLKQPAELAAHALECLQSLEPAGVGAHNLSECLLLQIRRDPLAPPGAGQAADQCLPLLAQGKLEKIAHVLGVTLSEVRQIAAYIRTLNPRPCSEVGSKPSSSIVPDAYIRQEDGTWMIRLNPLSMPKVSLSPEYTGWMASDGPPETITYLKDKWKSANLLLHGLKQRQATLYRVIEAILEEQPSFLNEGERGLKPLTLRTIAERLQFHESTVSRAVQNKYVWTPFGVCELKFFFGSGLATDAGDYASMRQIKLRVKELISEENKRHPLSDRKIVDILTEEGIQIARRTVTKYREEMNLLSSTLRKSI